MTPMIALKKVMPTGSANHNGSAEKLRFSELTDAR